MAVTPVTNLPLGTILQIAYSNGIRNQISTDFSDWEMIRRAKVSGHSPRSIDFYFQAGLLPSNVQWADPGQSNRPFPRAFQPSMAEYSAKMKEIQASVELEYSLWQRAQQSPEKYAEPLKAIIDSSMSSTKRELARALWLDGTGVIGTLGAAAAAVTSPASDKIVFTMNEGDTSRGFTGTFEYDEIYVIKTAAGAASALALTGPTSPTHFKCVAKDRDLGKVTMQVLNASFTSAGTTTAIATPNAAGDVFYKMGQSTFPNLTTVTDYGNASEMMAGLETLAANDGRTIHGITMSGATGGTEVDCGANPIDLSYLDQVLDKVKVEVGKDRYKWKMACSAPEVHSSLIEARETDRRFQSWEDNKRGTKVFGIVHRNDQVEFYDSEYVHKKRTYILPEAKSGEKVLEYHGSDFSTVKAPGGDDFRLKIDSGSYVSAIVSYMQATGVLISKHSKAIARLRNFTY